ncbi:TonB-dependent receptor [Rhodospirillum centenum]|uniref:TonB-dependent receptor, putative n=1 Tax=Rhodospirillum centenum (strain ATCC 51521 / SW) TaxID=414684 RepID=B6IPS5_RHOCS|nr:TonB-dependent receptor [Rhodospirillum centenum]ACI99777.1 TonB-dependent receptor, putative [Rhodospirillum centenum SW]
MRKVSLLTAMLLGTSSLAHAQTATPAGAAEPVAEIQEIIVTAQKRAQRISDVPMSISAYDSELLSQIGATELNRVAQITPGLVIQLQDRLLPGISLRGITSDDTSPASEPRVALFQDGIPITQIASAYAEMFDVDRVEVEKGPQSTLHGRSALNGGVSVFQKLPTPELGAEFKTGIGTYGYRQVQGVVNVPLSDYFGVRAGALVHKQNGYVKDAESDNSYNKIDARAYRLTASYNPEGDFSFDFAGTYDKDDTDSGGAFKSGLFLPLNQQTGAVEGDLNFWSPTHIGTFGQMPAAYTDREVLGLSGTARLEINDNLSLTSVSGYRWYSACQAGDIDGTPTNIIAYEQCNGGRQYSEEVRLNISDVGPFEGFIGAGYFKAENDLSVDLGSDERAMALLLTGNLQRYAPKGLTNNQIISALGSKAANYKAFHLDRKVQTADIQTYDVFADGTWHITEQLETFVGGRVTWDEKDVSLLANTPLGVSKLTGKGLLITSTPGGVAVTGDHSSTLVTGRVGVRYALTPSVNLYAVHGVGKRPDVVELTSSGRTDLVPEEKLSSSEAGVKYRLFNGRLQGDASVYHYTYSNFQTKQRVDGVLTSVNAGDASATGFETQVSWQIIPDLSVLGTYAYNHARFDNGAYEGNQFRNSPDHKFAIGLNATADVPFGTVAFAPFYSWQSRVFFSDDNDRTDLQVRTPAAYSDTKVDEVQKAYGLLNAKLSFAPESGPWSIDLVGENLLDRKFIVDAGNTGDSFGMPTFVSGTRRTVRVDLNVKF